MPHPNDWTPEHGDDEWYPDPERPVDSYSDTELRFCPLYRKVREWVDRELTDRETLDRCREVISGFLSPDDEPEHEAEPEPQTPQLRLV